MTLQQAYISVILCVMSSTYNTLVEQCMMMMNVTMIIKIELLKQKMVEDDEDEEY